MPTLEHQSKWIPIDVSILQLRTINGIKVVRSLLGLFSHGKFIPEMYT